MIIIAYVFHYERTHIYAEFRLSCETPQLALSTDIVPNPSL